jgi:glycosyltransferase involved in cell wall biosynthesis
VNAGAGASRPLRVLHLRDSPWVDGPGRTILETAARIDRTRVEYIVGAFASGDQPHPLVDALRQRGCPVETIRDSRGINSDLVAQVISLLERLDIDVLHTSEFRANILALLCRRRRPVTLVSTAHGWIANDFRGRCYRFADKLALRWFDAVMLVSHAMRRLVPRWWLPDSRVQVIHNALVLDSYGADVLNQSRVARDLSKGARLLNVGRLSAEKGQDLLLRAVAALAGEYPALALDFAGTGPEEQNLRELARSLGIADRVQFLGYVKDVPKLYQHCDLVVQSSLTEGLPNVILEAAYLRVPILATDVGGTREVAAHDRGAWLIEPGSLAALTDGLRRFLRDPARFAEMANFAHTHVAQNFSFTARTARLMDFYESLPRGAR